LPCSLNVTHAMVSDPEEANTTSPITVAPVLTSAHLDALVLPVDLITGLNPFNLSAYGLRARWPTLRVEHYCCDPQGLATRWLARPSKMGLSPIRLHRIARSLQNRKPDPIFCFSKLHFILNPPFETFTNARKLHRFC
jgi:hypothetical protein